MRFPLAAALNWFQFDDWYDASDAGLVFGKYGIGFGKLVEEVRLIAAAAPR